MIFGENQSTTQILTICRSIEGVHAEILEVTLLFIDFFKALDSIYSGKMEQIHLAYGLPKETVTTIIMLYKDMQAMVCSSNWGTGYFDNVAGVL